MLPLPAIGAYAPVDADAAVEPWTSDTSAIVVTTKAMRRERTRSPPDTSAPDRHNRHKRRDPTVPG